MLRRQISQRLACSTKFQETLASPERTLATIKKSMRRDSHGANDRVAAWNLFVASLPAAAQDKVEVFGGYTYMRFRPSPDVNLNGWEASVQYKFRDWIGGVADFDGITVRLVAWDVGALLHVWAAGVFAFARFAVCSRAAGRSAFQRGGNRGFGVCNGNRSRNGHRNQAGNQLADHSGGLFADEVRKLDAE